MATMTHVEQTNGSKKTLAIFVEDPCEKSDVGLDSTEVEKKAISNDLSSIMGFVQVHTQMNLVHNELKAMCTLDLAHDVFTIDTQESFNETRQSQSLMRWDLNLPLYSYDNGQEIDNCFHNLNSWKLCLRVKLFN